MKLILILLLLTSARAYAVFSDEHTTIRGFLTVQGEMSLTNSIGQGIRLQNQSVILKLKVPIATKPLISNKSFDLSESKKRFDYGRNLYLILKDKTEIPFSIESKYYTDWNVPHYNVPASASFQNASIETSIEKMLLRTSVEVNHHAPCKFKGMCATVSTSTATATIIYSDACEGEQKAMIETADYNVLRKWIIKGAKGTALITSTYMTSESRTAEELSRCVQNTAKLK